MISIHVFTDYAEMPIGRGGQVLDLSRHRHADWRQRPVGDQFL